MKESFNSHQLSASTAILIILLAMYLKNDITVNSLMICLGISEAIKIVIAAVIRLLNKQKEE